MSDSDIKVVISQKGTIPVYTVTKTGSGEVFTDETLEGKGSAETPLKVAASVIEEIHDAGKVIDVTVNDASVVRDKIAKVVVPTKLSDLDNDEGFITEVSWSEVQDKPDFATVATTGEYNDLLDKPNLGTMSEESADDYTKTADLAAVALSGEYNDLLDKPNLGTMSEESADDYTKTSGLAAVALSGEYTDLLDKPNLGTMSEESASDYTKTADLAAVALSGNYSDLSGAPTIPTVNDGILTIQKNSTTINTFTANSNSNVTIDISVPTKTSDITNDSGYITAPTITYNPTTEELTIS